MADTVGWIAFAVCFVGCNILLIFARQRRLLASRQALRPSGMAMDQRQFLERIIATLAGNLAHYQRSASFHADGPLPLALKMSIEETTSQLADYHQQLAQLAQPAGSEIEA